MYQEALTTGSINFISKTAISKASARVNSLSIILVGISLSLLQIADGVLTAIGMSRYGLHAEGNPLLRSAMHAIGYAPTLFLTKLFAVTIVVSLCVLAHRIKWIFSALVVITWLYLGAAVVPWTVILSS